MTQAFVYKWTQLSTGKWYMGSRTAKKCHINDGYICSSKVVKPLILEERSDWKREILVIGEPVYILEMEGNLLQFLNAKADVNSFNRHNNDMVDRNGKASVLFNKGNTPWNKGIKGKDSHSYGYVATQETRHILRESQLGEKNSMYGKKWYTDGDTSKMLMPGTEPTGFILGRTVKLRWFQNGISVKRFIPGTETNGYRLGRKLTQ